MTITHLLPTSYEIPATIHMIIDGLVLLSFSYIIFYI